MELSTYQDLQLLNTEENWTHIIRDGIGTSDIDAGRLLYAYTTFIRCTPNNPTRSAFHQHIYSREGIRDHVSVSEMINDTILLISQRKDRFTPRKEGEPAPDPDPTVCEFCI